MYETDLYSSMEDRPIKVLVIMGSARKANTYRAAERIREILQEEAAVEWEYVMLKDVNLEQCRGCYTCFDRGEEYCPIKDDSALLEQKMHDADGVIFATPVYGFQISGLMKVFIDRHSYICHRPRFFRQKALLLTSAGAVGSKDVLEYLDTLARIWGFEVVARAGIVSHAKMGPLPAYRVRENEEKLQAAAKAFLAALRRGKRAKPGLFDVMAFHIGRAPCDELGERSPADHAYWAGKGWLEKGRRYYVDVPVNPVYHALGTVAEWYLRRRVRRDLREVG
jgi:Multimeric flavodoxin WrbA